MTIKAIETTYNNYKFRSRLEARWAVFFDALGIKYEYEPEGFDLGDGIWYLPDFWLRIRGDWGIWVEIKPRSYFLDATDLEKELRFSISLWQKWLEEGGHDSGYMYSHVYVLCGGEIGKHEIASFSRTMRPVWDFNKKEWVDAFEVIVEHVDDEGFNMLGYFDWPDDDRVKKAYTAARQARFEHGETPNGKF